MVYRMRQRALISPAWSTLMYIMYLIKRTREVLVLYSTPVNP
jgi:hypothetical protein